MHALPRFASSLLLVLGVANTALAQNGASDDRVNLPDGPGSRDGVGDNATFDENMGLMGYGLPFEVPRGFAATTPQLGLSYSSGGGASVVGIGWSFAVPSIERFTAKGLPDYDVDDVFSSGPAQELVRVTSSSSSLFFYRARFEGGFVRYAWHDAADGKDGYFTAEFPDGTVSFFGADKDGVTAADARLGGAEGTFRWLVKETVDVWGHRLVYRYGTHGGTTPLLDRVDYAFDDDADVGAGAHASVVFRYDARPDVISDARGGFEELTADRLAGVDVFGDGVKVRSYALAYEGFDAAGGLSRLSSVTRAGTDGVVDPVGAFFRYSQGLGATCSGESCEEPQLVQMGSLGVNLQTRTATLIDMNGDGVPDVLEAAAGQAHRIHLSQLDDDGAQTWRAPITSALAGTSAHALTSPFVQPLDVNGDGFVDLLNAQSAEALINRGAGDWSAVEDIGGDNSALLNDLSSDLGKIRFLDADLDRRIDVLRADATGTTLYENRGDDGFVVDVDVDDIEAGFEEDGLQLADMNGDGLLDPVKLLTGEVQFRVNLGRGRFTDWRTIDNAPIAPEDLAFTSLEDLNGDGIDDIVIVAADEVRYALNRNSASFEEVASLTDAGGAALPVREATTTVLFADMNANGSDDIVWIDDSGNTTYLELFPIRPNLITHIDNGTGFNIDVSYTSSALARAKNPLAWQHPTPAPMLVVDTRDAYASLDDDALEQHDIHHYEYENAFYDSVEKMFRGYEVVTATAPGDDAQEELTTRNIFDLGVTSPARAGLSLVREWYGASQRLRRDDNVYEDCGVALAGPGVEFVCATSTTTRLEDGDDEDQFVTVRTRYEYDGFGNRVVVADDGVTGIGADGSGACAPCDADRGADVGGAPCGAQCTGDELVTETDFVAPPATSTAVGGWLLRLPQEQRTSTGLGRTQIERSYYDGADFVGLALGSATRGALTREETLLDDAGNETLQTRRVKRDAHGNVVELLRPNGATDGDDHRQTAVYDATGLDLVAEERVVARTIDGTRELLRLRRELGYDSVFDAPTTTTEWFLADEPASKAVTTFVFDALGRTAAVVRPGDSLATPTTEIDYDYGAVFTRITTKTRSVSGAADADIVNVECRDGRGRALTARNRIDDTRWLSTGVSIWNARGQVVADSDAFAAVDDECTAVVPAGVRVTRTRYDPLARELDIVEDDGADHGGTPSTVQRRYLPLRVIERDPEAVANDDVGAVADYDGLGRLVRVGRKDAVVDVDYDDLGLLRGYRDAFGNQRVQTRDLAGRIVSSTDPDRGTTTWTLDDEGSALSETQANGHVTRREFDALGRKTAEWDDADEAGSKMTFVYDRHPDCPGQSCDNGAGRLVGHTYPLGEFGVGVDGWGYDARGRATEATRQLLGVTFRMEAAFDAADRMTQETFPGGRVVDIGHDPLGRATDVGGVVDDIVYDPRGPMASMHTSNGVTTTFVHDARLRLVSLQASSPAGAVLDLTLTRDRNGNVTAVDDAAAGAVTSTARYQYDELSRLTQAVLGPSGSSETIDYRFDAIERLVEKGSNVTGSVDDIGDVAYAGDSSAAVNAGRAIERDAAGLATVVGDLALGYDHRDRLVDVKRDGADVARYFHTGSGYRVLKVAGSTIELTPFPGYEVRDGVSRLIIDVDGAPVVEEESAPFATALFPDGNDDGAITAADAWLARDEDVSGSMLRGAARRLLFADGDDDDDSGRAFLHADHRDATVAVSDADGAVKERLSYRPYGAVLATSAGASEYANFGGHDVDAETGFVPFGLRALDPVLGAFLTPDPAGVVVDDDTGITNVATAYNFARNNPQLVTDEGGAAPAAFYGKLGFAMQALGVVTAIVATGLAIGALSAGTMLVGNAIGAAVGGVVAFGFEVANQRLLAKQALRAGHVRTGWEKAAAVGAIAWATLKGVTAGTMSMGLSAAFQAGSGSITLLEKTKVLKDKPGVALALRAVLAAGSIATSGTLYGLDDHTFGEYGKYEAPGLGIDSTQSTLDTTTDFFKFKAKQARDRLARRNRPVVAAAAAAPLASAAPTLQRGARQRGIR